MMEEEFLDVSHIIIIINLKVTKGKSVNGFKLHLMPLLWYGLWYAVHSESIQTPFTFFTFCYVAALC